jgi:hypothetical protein
MNGKVQKTVLVLALAVPLALAGDQPEATKSLLDVPGTPLGVVAFDANGDARPDLVAWLDGGARAVLLCNAGEGRFLPACPLPDVEAASPSPLAQVVATDVDHDGDQDLVGVGAPSILLRNDGAGTFVAEEMSAEAAGAAQLAVAGPSPGATAVADFDGDARLDLAAPATTPQAGISILLASAAVDVDRPLVLLRGRLSDRRAPGGDRAFAAGLLPDGVDATGEVGVTLTAGDLTLDPASGAHVVVDVVKRRFTLVADGADFAAAPRNPVTVTLTTPAGRWRSAAAWRVLGNGELRWTAAPAHDTTRPAASPVSPFDVTTDEAGGARTTVIRERATGRTWRFDAATGRWVEVTRRRAPDEDSLGEGLVASLPLTGDLSDAGGRASAVSRGGVAFEGGEARFDGSGWIELPHIALDRRAHAFSMWIKPEGDSKVMGIVEQRDSNVPMHHYHLMLRGNSQPFLGFYVNCLAAPDPITHGEEHHLVFQYTGTKQQIWVDGALVAEQASPPYEGTTGATRIGRNPSWTNVGGTHFIGAMRNVRVYDRALAPAEVAEIRRREGRKDAAPTKALLVFDGPIDGSDRVVITAKEARWENVFWGTWRETVTLNGVPWTPRKDPVLPNSGATRFLPPGVDLTRARLVERSGRDHASIEVEGGRLVLRFVDSPNGIDRYRVVVAFD